MSMGRKSKIDGLTTAAPAGGRAIEKLVSRIIEGLPLIDPKDIEAVLQEVKQHPRGSLHYLFDRFGARDPATRAVVSHLVGLCSGADVIDNLNAVIIDAAQDDSVKVRANDILAGLGAPVDPDVFAMSVEDPAAVRKKLPAYTCDLLDAGDAAAAAEHARTLSPADRHVLIYQAAERGRQAEVAFLAGLAGDDADNASSVVNAIGAHRLEAGVGILHTIANTEDRALQKLVKRTLYELKKSGVAVPEEAPAGPQPGRERSNGEMPIYRAMVSQPSPNGTILAIIARERPNGRLKVFSVLVSLYKRGIDRAAIRLDISKSSFGRFLNAQSRSSMELREATVEECRQVAARGLRVSKELGTAIPFDFGAGKSLLGDVAAAAAAIGPPFLCAACGQPLDEEAEQRIRDTAAYDNIPVETNCVSCREASKQT